MGAEGAQSLAEVLLQANSTLLELKCATQTCLISKVSAAADTC